MNKRPLHGIIVGAHPHRGRYVVQREDGALVALELLTGELQLRDRVLGPLNDHGGVQLTRLDHGDTADAMIEALDASRRWCEDWLR